jgi:hypothetical protein
LFDSRPLLVREAIGQLTAHPDGMAMLLRHNQTVQWLYTLLASQVSIQPHRPHSPAWASGGRECRLS